MLLMSDHPSTPPDPKQCQTMRPSTWPNMPSFMTLGPVTWTRCTNQPSVLATDAAGGQMTLCGECQDVATGLMSGVTYELLAADVDHPSTPPRLEDLRQRAREAVELWHEYGLTVEFLEGMSYNHRVALVEAARRWVDLDLLAVLTSMGAKVIDTSDTIGWVNWGRYRYGDYQGDYVVIRKDALEGSDA